MMEIKLTQEKTTLVDDILYDYLSQWKWQAMKHHDQGSYYVGRRRLISETNRPTTIKLHRVIWEQKTNKEIPHELEIDHIDGNPLNNTISNLRLSTHQENCSNVKKQLHVSSIYKGVTWYKRGNNWTAQIRVNDKKIHLGYFENELDAAKKYDEAATLHFGKFARLNFGGTK